MKNQPLRTMVEIDDKKLSIETSLDPAQKQLVSTVQSNGQYVCQREWNIIPGTQEDGSDLISQNHDTLVGEIQTIFNIRGKSNENPTPDVCFMVGVSLLSFGFFSDALRQFKKALELNPLHVQASKYEGISLILLEDFENAKTVLETALSTAPGYPDMLFYLGNVNLYLGDFEQARNCYLKALEINPAYAEAHWKMATADMGLLAQKKGQMDEPTVQSYLSEAQTEAKMALQANPRMMNEEVQGALDGLAGEDFTKVYQTLLDSRPKYISKTGSETIYLYVLKLLYQDQEVGMQETEAYIGRLEKLVKENPNYADLHLHYGIAQLVKSSLIVDGSLREVRKALEVNQNFQKAKTSAEVVSDIHKRILQAVKSFYQPEG